MDDGKVLWIGVRHHDAEHESTDMTTNVPHKWFDGVLLALDRDSGAVLTAAVFDEFLYGFTNQRRLVLYDEYDNGVPRIRLAEISLRRNH